MASPHNVGNSISPRPNKPTNSFSKTISTGSRIRNNLGSLSSLSSRVSRCQGHSPSLNHKDRKVRIPSSSKPSSRNRRNRVNRLETLLGHISFSLQVAMTHVSVF
jgi:hypothetical protein